MTSKLTALARRFNDLPIFDAARWPHREWLGRVVAAVAVGAFFLRRVWTFPAQQAAIDRFSQSLDNLGATAAQIRTVEVLRHLQWGFEVGILVVYVVAFLFRRNAKGVARGFLEVVFPFLVAALPLVIGLSPSSLSRFVPTTSGGYTAALITILAIMTIGVAINFAGLWTLRRAFTIMTEAREMVTHGLFRWVRHPLYLGQFIAFFGVLLAHVHPWTVAVAVVFVVAQVFRSRQEERKLEATFPEYAAYKERTGMFFPRWGRRTAA